VLEEVFLAARTIKKLSIDLSRTRGMSFMVSPQNEDAFWGSKVANVDFARSTSFWSFPMPIKYSDQ
jgi:hypothetical protein